MGGPEGLSSRVRAFLQIFLINFVPITMLNVLITELSLRYGQVMARLSMIKYRASVTLDFDVPMPLSVLEVGLAGGILVWNWKAHGPLAQA